MSRITVFTATALTIGLATSTTPALASTWGSAPSRAHLPQGRDHDGHHGRHRHHWRFVAVGSAIRDIDVAERKLTVGHQGGPDLTFAISRFARITRDGARVALGDLRVGDRAFVRGVKGRGAIWAVRVDALS